MTDITGAGSDGEEVVIEPSDRRTGEVTELPRDMVPLDTGLLRGMPKMIRNLAGSLGLGRIALNRQYRLILDEPTEAACYLQGVDEATHGIADSLFSVLALRFADMTYDILDRRAAGVDSAAPTGPPELSPVPVLADRGPVP
jgi:L-ornithine N5-monooxygenase